MPCRDVALEPLKIFLAMGTLSCGSRFSGAHCDQLRANKSRSQQGVSLLDRGRDSGGTTSVIKNVTGWAFDNGVSVRISIVSCLVLTIGLGRHTHRLRFESDSSDIPIRLFPLWKDGTDTSKSAKSADDADVLNT